MIAPIPTVPRNPLLLCRCLNAAIRIFISLFFFLMPAITTIHELSDPNLRSATIPRFAWNLHWHLSPKFETWARKRLSSARAENLSTSDISGTEWPLFGSVFYLWSTESLQQAWEKDHSPGSVAPNVYAKGAIEAATSLVIDPTQASWVKTHWGTNYLSRENVFYRMLVISALTSHALLTGGKEHLAFLHDQADSLSAELAASPHGLLDDYPGECYPGDVLTAIVMIRRADKVLNTDHAEFLNAAIRGFQDKALDSNGLVPYCADARSGAPSSVARGCGNSYVSLFAPEIWPDQARKWYDLYSKYFWQESWGCAGFREFPKNLPGRNWYCDVDSGFVLGGFGCAASAFGVGAARVNGHFEQAYPLTAEMLATSWPLPNGTQLLPRLLSNAADAPFLGEAGVLFNLTRLPARDVSIQTGGLIPKFVLAVLTIQIGIGIILLVSTISLRRRSPRDAVVPLPKLQLAIWGGLLAAGILLIFSERPIIGIVCFLFAQLFPRVKRKAATT